MERPDRKSSSWLAVNFDKADIGDGGMKHSRSASILKKSPSSTGGGMRRSSSAVSFGSISVREHERVVEDVPTLHGPALSLGWAYNQKDDVHLDECKKDGDDVGATTDSNNDNEKAASSAQEDTDAEDDDTKEEAAEAESASNSIDKPGYIEPLGSLARSLRLRSYGFEHHELKTESQRVREMAAEGKRRAELARRKKEEKKLSFKLKKALGMK